MVYLGILIGLKNIRRISQSKKGALRPFLFTIDYVYDLAVAFYVLRCTALVAVVVAVVFTRVRGERSDAVWW